MSEDLLRGYDESFYISFGCAIMANMMACLASPILIARNWRFNSIAVISNVFLIISNWVNFGAPNTPDESCKVKSYTVQVFMILGSIFQMLAPFSRIFVFLSRRVKIVVTLSTVALVAAEFCSLVDFSFHCKEESSRFAEIFINPYSNVFANLFGFVVSAIAFHQIIKLINTNELIKENSRMQIVKKVAIGCVFVTGGIKIGCLLGYITDENDGAHNNQIEMVLKSSLGCAITFCFLFLELSTRSKESLDNTELSLHISKGNPLKTSSKHQEVVSISVKE
eukprot:NODE_204_length_14945_cov_0.251313.p5 type:complete len:280 gc:universal NODE_204_length_14945_cov_0.251313:9550-8711(-)